jgi:ADP-ribose pyrophosphatase YjhB (NUDIX family)
MITREIDGTRFIYRVAAVIIEDGCVLVNRLEGMDFWFLPGGQIGIDETSEAALVRELAEELGVATEVGRLLWVIENFFGIGPRVHEVGLYYVAQLPGLGKVWHGSGIHRTLDAEGTQNEFQWWDVERLSALRLMPAFLRQAVRRLPPNTQHLVLIE